MANKKTSPGTSYESILQQASKQKKGVYRISKTYPAYIALIIMILISLGAWYLVDQKVKSDKELAFEKATSSVMTRLDIKYQDNYNVLMSMRRLYDNYVQVVRDIFELYGTIPIQSYPSIITITYAPIVHHEDLELYIYNTRSEGYYYYTKIIPEGVRDIYCPIKYIVPLEKNFHRSGVDFFSDPVTKAKIETARDSNKVVATQVYTIRQPDTTGFYIISPVYMRDSSTTTVEDRRNHFEGALVLEVESPLFFERALGSGVASDTSIVFQCVDVDKNGNEKVIFESDNSYLLKLNYQPDLQAKKYLGIADRKIEVRFSSIPDFGGSFQKFMPFIILGISLLISVAFFLFLLSVITRKARAVELAERMTRSQRRIVESSKDIISVLDLGGVWKSMNPASVPIFGLQPDEMIGNKIDTLFQIEDDKEKFYNMVEKAADESTERTNFRMVTDNGETRWIDWSFNISKTDGLVYCVGRDITLEKIAEDQARLRLKQNELAEQLTKEASAFKSYFMIKLSHQLRNSLTGIIGYLQLLSQQIYENEEERDTFIHQAEISSEELFAFVSDIDDVASASDEDEAAELAIIKLDSVVKKAAEKVAKESENDEKINVEITEEGAASAVLADSERLTVTLSEIYQALSMGLKECNIQVNAQENPYEGATEIQILGSGNKQVEELIEVYKGNMNKLIEALEKDENDILLSFAKAASNIRMMNGFIKIETFGGDEGNVVLINLPLNKQQTT